MGNEMKHNRFFRISINTKLKAGFGFLLILITVISVYTFLSVMKTAKYADEIVSVSKVGRMLVQAETEFQKWSGQVQALFSDDKNVKHLTAKIIENDYNKCGLGKWLRSRSRKNAQSYAPELVDLINKLEKLHIKLHRSVKVTNKYFKPVDPDLSNQLIELKSTLQMWVRNIEDVLGNMSQNVIDTETDYYMCKTGRWILANDEFQLEIQYPETAGFLNKFASSHHQMHISIFELQKLLGKGNRQVALKYYNTNTKKRAEECLSIIKKYEELNQADISDLERAKAIHNKKTVPIINEISSLFDSIDDIVMRRNVSLESIQMAAKKAKYDILKGFFIIIAFVILFLLYYLKIISKPIIRISEFISNISKNRDLTSNISVKNSDEVGEMADAVNRLTQMLRDDFRQVYGSVGKLNNQANTVASSVANRKNIVSSQQTELEKMETIIQEMEEVAIETIQWSKTRRIANNTNNFAIESIIKDLNSMKMSANLFLRQGADLQRTGEKSDEVIKETIKCMKDISFMFDQMPEMASEISELSEKAEMLSMNSAAKVSRINHENEFASIADDAENLSLRLSEAAKDLPLFYKKYSESVVDGLKLAEGSRALLHDISKDNNSSLDIVSDIISTMEESVNRINNTDEVITELTRRAERTEKQSELQADLAIQFVEMFKGFTKNASKSMDENRYVADIAQELKTISNNLVCDIERYRYLSETCKNKDRVSEDIAIKNHFKVARS